MDGVFGKETYDGVVYFQRKNGLKVDGAVGQTTAAALGVTLSGGAVAVSNPNESETYLLARLIHGEARGEPYVGKVAVAAVVLNRVRHPSFPNTIAGVIYQPGAFDAVWDGQINLTPDSDSLRAARGPLRSPFPGAPGSWGRGWLLESGPRGAPSATLRRPGKLTFTLGASPGRLENLLGYLPMCG